MAAEHKYVSLKDVLRDNSIPKLESREPNFIESQVEVEFELISKNSRNPNKFPSSPSFGYFCDKRKTKAKKKGLGGRFSCLKLSRSDDQLVYVERHVEEEDDDDDDDDDAFDELEALSQEMKIFSWKERILKSTLFSESEEEEEEN